MPWNCAKSERSLASFRMVYLVGLLFPWIACSQSLSLPQILTYLDWQNSENVLFMLNTENPAAISELRMSFLNGEDCYSGYQQNVRIYTVDTPFVLHQNQPFGLNSSGIYQAAQTVLDSESLTNIQAILIRFVDLNHGQRYQQFAWFSGSCQDQGINCCIPITCSTNTKMCKPKYNMGTQFVSWV